MLVKCGLGCDCKKLTNLLILLKVLKSLKSPILQGAVWQFELLASVSLATEFTAAVPPHRTTLLLDPAKQVRDRDLTPVPSHLLQDDQSDQTLHAAS
jgi:hypothetical protein